MALSDIVYCIKSGTSFYWCFGESICLVIFSTFVMIGENGLHLFFYDNAL